MRRSILVLFLMTYSASALYYHPSDPCNLVPYDYLRAQLCCNGTVYADPPFIYTCCYDFVCYRVNNMPVDPQILHPISRYFPATKPGLASGHGALPGVPVPQDIFAPPDYESQEPSTLIGFGDNTAFVAPMASPMASPTPPPFNATPEIADALAQPVAADPPQFNSTTEAPAPSSPTTTAEIKKTTPIQPQELPKVDQQMRMDLLQMPQQLPNFPTFSGFNGFAQAPQQQNLGKQFWNPFQTMFQGQEFMQPEQPATKMAAKQTTKAPAATTTFSMNQQPGLFQFLQNMFPKEMQFASFGQQMMMSTPSPIEEAPVTEAADLYCDGINLSLLQQANPSLSCCAKMVIYDSRLYSCVESDGTANATTTTTPTTTTPAATTTTQPPSTVAATTSTPILVPINPADAPVAKSPQVVPVAAPVAAAPPPAPTQPLPPVVPIIKSNDVTQNDATVPVVEPAPQEVKEAPTTTPQPTTVANKVIPPAKRSAKLSPGSAGAALDDLHHLPADFVPLTCGIHEYYIDPSISSKFACCGDAIFDVTTELCEHVWGMYYAMAAVPINEDGKPPVGPARLDCNELKTYIFGNPSVAANYSC